MCPYKPAKLTLAMDYWYNWDNWHKHSMNKNKDYIWKFQKLKNNSTINNPEIWIPTSDHTIWM
jgi:hypothetical protein